MQAQPQLEAALHLLAHASKSSQSHAAPALSHSAHSPSLTPRTCRPGPKWLSLYISYTGFELEASEEACPHCTAGQCLLRPSLLSQPPAAAHSAGCHHCRLPPHVVPPCKLMVQGGGDEGATRGVEFGPGCGKEEADADALHQREACCDGSCRSS